MKKSAIIFDIDSTAIDSPEQELPTERLVSAVKKAAKNYFICAATGRVWSFAEPVLKGMELTDPCIISGGTQICSPVTSEILWQLNINDDALNNALKIFKKNPEYKVLYNDYTREDYLYGGHDPRKLAIDEPVYFIEQTFVPKDLAPAIITEISKISGIECMPTLAQRPGFIDIHVSNIGATKEHAVAELLKLIKVGRENTVGVGDGYNDLHLFNAVHHKVAVTNAVDELLSRADQIIGDVKEDGFAAYLESLS